MTRSLDWDTDGRSWPNRQFSHFVDTGDCWWHIQRAGTGPRVLLIHGTGASTHSWAGLFPRLARTCDVFAADLPGHAFTRSRGEVDQSLSGMTKRLKRLLEQTGFQPEVLIGHSAGAAIALRLGPSMKSKPGCIVSLNGALRPLGGIAGMLGPAIAKAITFSPLVISALSRSGRDRDRVARLIRSTGSEPSEPYLGIYTRLFATPAHVQGTFRMMASWDVSNIIGDVRKSECPIFQFTGELDQAVPPAAAAELAAQFPHVNNVSMPGLGHLAHEENPDALASEILNVIETCKLEGLKQPA